MLQRDSGREWDPWHALRVADAAVKALEALEVRLPPENRLALSRRRLADFLAHPQRNVVFGYRELIAAQQNAIETFLIARTFQLAGRANAPRLLRNLLRGNLDLREDSSGAARDLQFELILLALCDLAGMSAKFGEPDIIIADAMGDIGVAAKRIASERSIRNRVRSAVSQILRTTKRGIVAINVDQLVSTLGGNEARASLGRHTLAAYQTIEDLGSLGPVVGVFAMGSVIHRRPDGIPTLSYDFSLRMVSSGDRHDRELDWWSSALGTRAIANSDALFAEVLGSRA